MTDDPDLRFLDDITCRDCGVTMGNADGPMKVVFPDGDWVCEKCLETKYDELGRAMIERGLTPIGAARDLLIDYVGQIIDQLDMRSEHPSHLWNQTSLRNPGDLRTSARRPDKIRDVSLIELCNERHVSLQKVAPETYLGDCPFCAELSVLHVTPKLFECAACFRYGDAITFVMEIDRVGYVEAVKKLAARFESE